MKNVIQQYAKDLTAGRLASGYEHSYRTYHLARQVGEDTDYDDQILHAACFLHDIERMVDHPRGSAEKARAILTETGFPAGKVTAVADAIVSHLPGGDPQSVEARLLHDADLLDSIGAVGFARLSIGAFFWHHYRSLEQIIGMVEAELANAEDFIYPKARELARDKKAFLCKAIDQLKKELAM